MADVTKKVWAALGRVQDPDLGKDLVTLGMIKDLKVDRTAIAFTIELTTPACPLKETLKSRCVSEIEQALGSEVPALHIDFSARVTRPPADKASVLPQVRNIIGVASGKGGVGKSTLSANLAIALAQSGAQVGLLDADITGPSVPILFGCRKTQPEVFKKDGRHRIVPVERYGIQLLSIGMLVAPEQALVWRGPMTSNALRQLFTDAEWHALDYLIVDLPPGTSDIPLTIAQTIPLSGMVILTTPEAVAIEDVRKCITMCQMPQLQVPILGIVENMSYFQPKDAPSKKYYLFGQGGGKRLANDYALPLLAELPFFEDIREGSDKGYPFTLHPGPYQKLFHSLAKKVAQQVAIHNARPSAAEKSAAL